MAVDSKQRVYLAVVGAGNTSPDIYEMAMNVGKEAALRGWVVVTGGLGGVMEAAAKGAREAGGLSLGILPGGDRNEANPYIDIPIVTGMGEARNLTVIRSSDAVIALPGKYGTLSELSFALKLEKPVVGISTWDISERVAKTKDPKEAVKLALDSIEQK